MNRFSSFTPSSQAAASVKNAKEATDFLHRHEKMAALIPAITRMGKLQRDCMAILPSMFEPCSVLNFQSELLVLSLPNAALAAKLKQQLPKLKNDLLKKGWQVSDIRLKVKTIGIPEKSSAVKQLILSAPAMSALAALGTTLEDSPRNQALKTALKTMIQRHGFITKVSPAI